MYPGDKREGKRTSGLSPPDSPFSNTPLICNQAGSTQFSFGQPAVGNQPSSQIFSFPLNTSSMMPPPWTHSSSSFRDSLETWSPSPFSALPPPNLSPSSSLPIPNLSLILASPSAPVENRDNSRGDGSGETTLGLKRRADTSTDPVRGLHKRSASTDSYFDKANAPYTPEELEKIKTSKRLTELSSDRKKIRKILANREAATRSRERRDHYITQLENKVSALENNNASERDKIAILMNEREVKMELNKRLKNQVETKDLELQMSCNLTETLKAEYDRLMLKIAMNEQMIQEMQQLQMTNDQMMNQSVAADDNQFSQQQQTNMLNESNNDQFNQQQTNSDCENPNEQLYGDWF